ncbi:Uma2 family endonuclease [Rhodopirellula halodulae]|uniref:Uma2 family endonuclease n=1 Tax=Rhodopirellula halodulae TaxID=2894198 RepID=UPI001E290E27|nr:Uma2 family endonuclease [Rhodopirellula sp. JC737]MCC9656516.1 Uma2 family endonuclease [Rhodopirellula sp. JC737]
MTNTLHLTLSEYDTMVRLGAFDHVDRKVELIRGELVEMNPAGPLHDYLITYLNNWSVRHTDPSQTLVTSQTGLDLPEQTSRPEPDLMWLRNASYRASHPNARDVQLAMEVAYTSLGYDLENKRILYATAGIIEYWIVDAMAKCIHVFRDSDGGDYQTRFVVTSRDESLSPLIALDAKLNLQDLFEGN